MGQEGVNGGLYVRLGGDGWIPCRVLYSRMATMKAMGGFKTVARPPCDDAGAPTLPPSSWRTSMQPRCM